MTAGGMHEAIRAELEAHAEPWKLPVMQRFFKDPIDAYCTYTPHVRAIAKRYGAEFGAWSEQERTALAREREALARQYQGVELISA